MHFALNKPVSNLMTDDIPGTKPTAIKFQTRRVSDMSNPLNPSYKLPSYEIKPATPRKFLRDGLNVKDIPGSSPVQRTLACKRNSLDVSDV